MARKLRACGGAGTQEAKGKITAGCGHTFSPGTGQQGQVFSVRSRPDQSTE